MVLAVERRWQEPDNGIWEIRGPRRHYVHSKLMCWLAVDRAIRLADQFRGGHPPAWDGLNETIREDALTQGWDETLGGFRLAYDVSELDAASVLVGLHGLIPVTDERFVRTVESVDRLLRVNSAVYRYRFDDGLPGREGGMLICLGWLIEAYAALGAQTKAEALFERLMACAGHTGLLAEQVDAVTGIALGNFPQVYSHLALINSAVALDRRFPRD
jgi:trehalose 6-phosphate phosphatase